MHNRTITAFLLFILATTISTPSHANSGAGSSGGRWVHLHAFGDTHLVYGDDRDEPLLSAIYGPDWRNSVAYRSALMIQNGQPVGDLMDDLQGTHFDTDIYYNIIHDDTGNVYPGETLSFYDPANRKWITHTSGGNETIDDIAKKYNTTIEDIQKYNSDRFNVHPHARERGLRAGDVYIAQDWHTALQNDNYLGGLLAHEGAHTTDRVGGHLRSGDYGTIDGHDFGEITTQRGAIIEGWAEYNQALIDPGTRQYIRHAAEPLYRDDKAAPGNRSPVLQPTHDDLLASEATIADILLQIDNNDLVRRRRLQETMKDRNANIPIDRFLGSVATDDDKVGLDRFLERYVQLNPEDASDVMFIYDVNTQFKASNEHLEERFGAAGTDYMSKRNQLLTLWEQFKERDFFGTPSEFLQELEKCDATPLLKPSNDGKQALDPMTLLDEGSCDGASEDDNKGPDDGASEDDGKGSDDGVSEDDNKGPDDGTYEDDDKGSDDGASEDDGKGPDDGTYEDDDKGSDDGASEDDGKGSNDGASEGSNGSDVISI